MQNPRKPARPAGVPRTYVLEVRGIKCVATRNDFAFAWQDKPGPNDPDVNQPITATINGVRYVAQLRGGVLRWEVLKE